MAEDPSLWDDPESAQATMRERTRLDTAISGYRNIETELNDNIELIELGEVEDDSDVVTEAEKSISSLAKEADRLRLESLLSGEADANDAFLEVHAGAGGTESQDWADMLMRMYTRWAEAHRYKVEWIEESPGEEAGIKSATIKVSGGNAFGWLKTGKRRASLGAHFALRFEQPPPHEFCERWRLSRDR